MPGIITSISSGVNNTLFGDVQGPLVALLEEEYSRFESNESFTLWKKIFPEFKLDSNMATIGSLGAIGLFEDVGENGAYPASELREGFQKLLTAQEWKNSFAISQTMMEDKLDFILADNAKQLVASYFRTKNSFFWGLLGAALKNTDYVTPKKKKISVKTMDGVNVFSGAHKLAHASGTVGNAFKDAFSASALGKVAEHMQNMVDDNGEIIGLVPDTIIIPNTEEAKSAVFGVIGASHDTTTAAGNKFNYQFGNWEVIVSPWLASHQTADGFPWLLMDSDYNQRRYGARDVERIQMTVRSEIAANDANVWKGRGRFGGAFIDFRAFAAGGVSFGADA